METFKNKEPILREKAWIKLKLLTTLKIVISTNKVEIVVNPVKLSSISATLKNMEVRAKKNPRDF